MSEYPEKSKYICNAYKKIPYQTPGVDMPANSWSKKKAAICPIKFAIQTFLNSPLQNLVIPLLKSLHENKRFDISSAI